MYMYMYTCELYKCNMSCNNVYIFWNGILKFSDIITSL